MFATGGASSGFCFFFPTDNLFIATEFKLQNVARQKILKTDNWSFNFTVQVGVYFLNLLKGEIDVPELAVYGKYENGFI